MFNLWRKKGKMLVEPLTKISRIKTIEGFAVPAIIHNDSYFFVDLSVYEDGTVECWEMTDLNLFKDKLETGWVKTSVPNGKSISVHGLGSWKIDDGNWMFDKQTFFEYVGSILEKLNPQMQNLHKVFEKKINGVTILESGRGNIFKDQSRYENEILSKKINGGGFNVFFKEEEKYFLVNLVVFADEKIQLHRVPEIVEFDFHELQNQIEIGNILTEIPTNFVVEIYGLGKFKILTADYPCTSVQDKLLEVRDLIEEQNNRHSSVEVCRAIFEEYLKTPTFELKEKLKIAYENIPKHKRMYVGDMDTKDTAVRMIIYSEDEIKNWSHYIVAKSLEEGLPTINVPKPEDK